MLVPIFHFGFVFFVHVMLFILFFGFGHVCSEHYYYLQQANHFFIARMAECVCVYVCVCVHRTISHTANNKRKLCDEFVSFYFNILALSSYAIYYLKCEPSI